MTTTMKLHGYMKLSSTLNYEDALYPITLVVDRNKVNFVKAEVTKINKDLKC